MADYAVTLQRRYDGLFIASFADVPDATAFGRDGEEALEEAARSLDAALKRRVFRGEKMPEPRASGELQIGCRDYSI